MNVVMFDHKGIAQRVTEFQIDRGYSNADMANLFSVDVETYSSLKYSKGKGLVAEIFG